MPDKSFEHTFAFHQGLPLVPVTLIQPNGNRVGLSLLFDTGASQMTLRHDLYPLLGVPAWDSGQRAQVATAGGDAPVSVYAYEATFEFLGVVVRCPVHLVRMPAHPLYQGLFGRELMFDPFGFGFWESAHELYVTLTP